MKITYDDLASFIPSLHQPGEKTLLNIGCGTVGPERLPECFKSSSWREIRLDIDKRVKPDVVASFIDMKTVNDATIDAVWSSHNLEHLESFEVPKALAEIHRVLKPGGFALITLPDLERIAQLIVDGQLETVLYTSPAGPITPLDMLFGHQVSISRGNHYMAHRTGFTAERLGNQLTKAGFEEVRVMSGKSFDLWTVARIAA
ncbi:class I SAM-dependent methyltransferase [Azomonas macrocytogenes]|uniref:Putative SAM-dependent methyltransferase n=1 Tax=Azomonas macrocytogenes TaxID=69962 RepID=A0A839SZ83_AZOMA|nr:class I SAM-dependent methyltransferase [Azomonas macrocytogenes]MBB3102462.1 putative SAM-dependent methyltransferase [Azomonas macrocytogenes]